MLHVSVNSPNIVIGPLEQCRYSSLLIVFLANLQALSYRVVLNLHISLNYLRCHTSFVLIRKLAHQLYEQT